MMVRYSDFTIRAVALDNLAAQAKLSRVSKFAYYWPGRLLAVTEPLHPGAYVRVPVFELRTDDCSMPIQDFAIYIIRATLSYKRDYAPVRAQLFVYLNDLKDLAVFNAALDEMFEDAN